ncbi:MAG: MFS transporter [Paludibacterium sp.]|uniref:MFS transporter n=1 Tax=Paludibacterium sp. TaxID=1917523 RepID=UPI0025F9A0AB|nr:MFS transporter [Paludibacterium sp.]MBV8048481.1 MFS transporter [Paludibacterium sp.]
MKIKGLRWWMISLVTLGTVLNYLARNSLAVAAPRLITDLHISTQQYSYVVAAFQACYMFMQPVAGYVVDFLGTKIGFALFAVCWSAANLLHGFASGWLSLAFFRGLLGVTESAVIPAGLKASSEWFPAKERSIATGWFNVGSSIGGLIAPPLVVWCILHSGWQSAFIVTGSIGFIWAAVWLKFYKHPRDQKALSDEERQYILSGQEEQHKDDSYNKPSWREIVGCRQFWGIAIPRFLAEPAWQTFNFWIPLYMMTVHHMNLKQIAIFAWMPFLAADMGCIVGGYLPAFYLKYFKVDLITSRKLVVVMGGLMMIGPGLLGLVSSPYVAIALFCLGGFAHQSLSGALITLSSDVFGKKEVATANGLTGMSAWLGATIFTLISGALLKTVGYGPLFVCLAAFDVIGAIVVWNVLLTRPAHLGVNKSAEQLEPAGGAL